MRNRSTSFYLLDFLRKILLVLLIAGLAAPAVAGSRYTVFPYKSQDYKAGTQNWGICPDASGRFFIANNSGLLVLDGSGISVYPLPRGGVVRSVACFENRVYTGSFEEFGYWEEIEGKWTYTSLVSLVKPGHFQNDEIWKIVRHKQKIYFQSFGNIFVYDGNSIEALDIPGPVLFLLQSDDRLFVQEINGGLHEIKNQKLELIPGSKIFSDTEIKSIFRINEKQHVIGTGSKGLYVFDGSEFMEWNVEVSGDLKNFKLNNGVLAGGQMVFGTILKGIIVADLEGRLLHHIHSGNGLQNNTVLSIYHDGSGNIWAGLDKGIDHVWLNSPLKAYRDNYTEAGSVYTAALFNNILYVGTNQGIYYFSMDARQNIRNRGFIEGSQGQVWFLKEEDGNLYCGLNDGTYRIAENRLIKVSDVNGGYNFVRHRLGNEDIMLQSTYTELIAFEKKNSVWTKNRNLGGFSAPIRYMSLDHLGNMFLGHAVKGLFLAEPAFKFDSILNYRLLNESDGVPIQGNKVFKIDNRIVIPSESGFFQWDPLARKFILFHDLNQNLGSFANANTAIEATHGRYWFIKPDEIGLFEIRQGKARLLLRIIPEMYDINLVDQYENIVALNDSLQLICMNDGFGLLNLNHIMRLAESSHSPHFRSIEFISSGGAIRYFTAENLKKKLSAANGFNTVNILISTDGAQGNRHFFQYRLDGIDEKWSSWESNSRIEYTRLPPGNYTFRMRGLTARGIETAEVALPFRIRQPWFLSPYAFIAYFVLMLAFILLLYTTYRRRQWRRQERLLREENERIKALNKQTEAELMKITNDQLQKEVVSKNLELAKNTMVMVRKNELLIEIRDELDRQREDLGTRLPARYYTKINKLIENSLNSEHDWEMFEHLFDQAHENFFKRLKHEYTDLTPSDFRLCAYLRMNLSSKEIAPLLNISIRGVEEKRYRLRKKMNLSPEQNLTEFIISF